MHRSGVPGPEPGDLLVDGIDVALGQELTDPPHVPVQRQQLVPDVFGDLAELLVPVAKRSGACSMPDSVCMRALSV